MATLADFIIYKYLIKLLASWFHSLQPLQLLEPLLTNPPCTSPQHVEKSKSTGLPCVVAVAKLWLDDRCSGEGAQVLWPHRKHLCEGPVFKKCSYFKLCSLLSCLSCQLVPSPRGYTFALREIFKPKTPCFLRLHHLHQLKTVFTSCASFYTDLYNMTFLVSLGSPLQFKIKLFGCTRLPKLHPWYIIWEGNHTHVNMSVESVPLLIRGALVEIMPRNVRWIWASCGRCVPVDGGSSSQATGELSDEGRRRNVGLWLLWSRKLSCPSLSLSLLFLTPPSPASLSNSRHRRCCGLVLDRHNNQRLLG